MEESPSRSSFYVATPGPGSYEADATRSVTSVLHSNADKPQPAFRSRTSRFGTEAKRFATADPIHLEPGSESTPRDKTHFAKPSPVAFRRGNSAVMTTLGGTQ